MAAETSLIPDPQSLFDDAPCGLIVTREDGSILRANKTFCTWIGWESSDLQGRRFQDLLTMGGRIFHQTHWSPLIQMQGSVAEVKLDLVHRDKTLISMLLNGVRQQHASGVVHQLALFCTTDRDKYERELLKARQLAEELLANKVAAEAALSQAQTQLNKAYEKAQRRALFAEQMVAIVSHDLKNPLTAIKMAAEILGRKMPDGKDKLMLSHISSSTDRAHRMIADLLDFALARVGRGISVSRSVIDLHSVVAQSVAELRVAFPDADLEHRSVGRGDVELDADRMQQIIGNLIANSAAYGDPKRPITVISTVDTDRASISVHNFGPAIPESARAKLFEPMTRGSDQDGQVRSVGLGLFIVREIITAHGGDISVHSTADEGTTFTVKFPGQAD
ncbi:PAS domain-containing sensor histidine kinase [Pseudomonas moraviensis subsp. stanleyae]|uniref:PAS domain-containing sensor histidine kinase n=1 Tax=Pseudomonas moraviensis TaxID=321662 RepID=UPI002E36B809|nr:PAS domain-containing sensor histidine kinase [Pseudomonas moraviensis]MED7669954.1 PAS domain-containing sensor histidine kinase [Pseudomonas moraviensis subsp. stanleyae]